MLARLGASLKAIGGARLSYADLAAVMRPSLTNPERLLGELAESVYVSWNSVTGNGSRTAFTESWRTELIHPHLRAIADQPTPALQRWKLKDSLLSEGDGLTMVTRVLKLPEAHAEAFLISYPDEATANDNGIVWKREHLGLEGGIHLLNICALLDLAQRGFGIDADDTQAWLDLYSHAIELVLNVRIFLRTLHVVDPQSYSRENSLAAEAAFEPVLAKMNALLSTIKDEVASGPEDTEHFRELYNRLVDVKADFLRQTFGLKIPDSEKI